MTLDEIIVAYCRKKRGMAFKAEHLNFRQAVAEHPELLGQAKAKILALEGKPGDRRRLSEHDSVGKEQYAALTRMVAEVEQENVNG